MIIRSKFRQLGYLYNDNRVSGGKLTEADLTTCRHCEKILLKKQWKFEGGRCSRCDGPICLKCSYEMDVKGCVAFVRIIDQQLDRLYHQRQYDKILGLGG